MSSCRGILIPLISIWLLLTSTIHAQDPLRPDWNSQNSGAVYMASTPRKDTQTYGLNPFGPDALKALVPGTNMPEGIDWAEVDKIIYSGFPSSEELRKRWLAQKGAVAPVGTEKLLKTAAEPYIRWAISQPEVIAAQKTFKEYLAKNYVFVPGNEGEAPRYRKISSIS